MGYYNIVDDNDNLIASNVWIDESGYGGSGGGFDALAVSSTLLYFIGFIGTCG